MRNLLVAAIIGVSASALTMAACGGDDTTVEPGDDSGASPDATSPLRDAGMGMVVDTGAAADSAPGVDATTGDDDGGDATTGSSDASSGAETSTGADAADAGDNAADAGTEDAADAADASDAADAADAQDAADASEAGDASDAADAADAAPTFFAPKCDGVIGAGEYGPNSYSSGGQVWHMTWDDTNLYIGLEVAPVDHPVLLYLDTVAGAGLYTPYVDYDGIAPSNLGIGADLLVYEKTGYNATRTVSPTSNDWSVLLERQLTVCDNNGTGQTREIVVPWKISAAGRPSSFLFFGMAEDSGDQPAYIFGQMPADNPTMDKNDTDPIAAWFTVNDTTPSGAGSAFATVTHR